MGSPAIQASACLVLEAKVNRSYHICNKRWPDHTELAEELGSITNMMLLLKASKI